MAWTQPGPGRPPGSTDSPNCKRQSLRQKKISAAAEFANKVLDDADYRANLLERARKGQLAPQVETALFYYAYGKPTEHVAIEDRSPTFDPKTASPEELEVRARRLADAMAVAKAREAQARAEEAGQTAPVLAQEPKSVS